MSENRLFARAPCQFSNPPAAADFEAQLERRNPGAGAIVQRYVSCSLQELGITLRDSIPLIVAKSYEPGASTNVLEAQLEDIIG